MKILHSADWHLDAPITGRTPDQARFLREELLKIPDRIASVFKAEGCDLLLLAGDLFDGPCTPESLHALRTALEEISAPVFIAPGNHDFCHSGSPYIAQPWPENVHIFTHPAMEAAILPELDCTVYGAGYTAMDCPALLQDLTITGGTKWNIGLLHSDPLQAGSPYAPVTARQVKDSGLDYLALGHIHKGGSFRAGDVLCAWPGCPMGRGYDEAGMKGALLVELGEGVRAEFLPMNTPRFFDETVEAGSDAAASAAAVLPPVNSRDFYRLTFTGYSAPIDLSNIAAGFPHIPNLELRDRTLPEIDLWSAAGEDSLEGVYFRLLHEAMNTESEALQERVKLAAKISRQILDGQEVTLP